MRRAAGPGWAVDRLPRLDVDIFRRDEPGGVAVDQQARPVDEHVEPPGFAVGSGEALVIERTGKRPEHDERFDRTGLGQRGPGGQEHAGHGGDLRPGRLRRDAAPAGAAVLDARAEIVSGSVYTPVTNTHLLS